MARLAALQAAEKQSHWPRLLLSLFWCSLNWWCITSSHYSTTREIKSCRSHWSLVNNALKTWTNRTKKGARIVFRSGWTDPLKPVQLTRRCWSWQELHQSIFGSNRSTSWHLETSDSRIVSVIAGGGGDVKSVTGKRRQRTVKPIRYAVEMMMMPSLSANAWLNTSKREMLFMCLILQSYSQIHAHADAVRLQNC